MTNIVPWEIRDLADELEGASREPLIDELCRTLDEVYFLRGMFAWTARQLGRALRYRGFSAARRPFAMTQQELCVRLACGGAESVMFSRGSHFVELATKHRDVTIRRDSTPEVKREGEPASEDLRLGFAYALRELRLLRQLAVYEAGVARVHDIPSGPKAVRTILEGVNRRLLLAARTEVADYEAMPGDLRAIDRREALRHAGVPQTLTMPQFLAEHGLKAS